MIEEEKKTEVVNEVVEDELLPAEIDTLPLEKDTAVVVNKIVKAKDADELKSYTDLFSLNMAKKNAVRIAKLQNLLDKVNDNAIDRFEKHPDEFSNKEVLDYMKVIQDQITAASNAMETLGEKPMIQVNNQKNEVNINVDSSLSRESKTKILEAVKGLLSHVSEQNVDDSEKELYNIGDESDMEDEENNEN